MLRIKKSFSKFTLQFWKKWVKIVVYLVVYTTFIYFWDTWQNANRFLIIFQSFLSFLKTGVISAFLRLLGKTLLNTELLKLCYNIYEKISLFSFNILIGITCCCVALLELRFCISLENFSWVSNLKENVQLELLTLLLMFIILGCSENFSIDWMTGSVWNVSEIRYRFWKYLGFLQHL